MPHQIRRFFCLFVGVTTFMVAPHASAEIYSSAPTLDNTLYEDNSGSLSNALGPEIYVGVNPGGENRRGFIYFDLSGEILPGATVTSVSLSMTVPTGIAGSSDTYSIHELDRRGGEGTSEDISATGAGDASTAGDATWKHFSFPSDDWDTLGGDFDSAASASAVVSGAGTYNWSSADMIADVQGWVDDPASNNGWLVKGTESATDTMEAFASREDSTPANQPLLVIEFTPAKDYGDAPDPTYPTLSASAGASHKLVSALYLGSGVDDESDGQPNATATGDTNDDGITFVTPIVPGEVTEVGVNASNFGLLHAWVDFNGDGDWDDLEEQVFANTNIFPGNFSYSFTTPEDAVITSSTFARFRFTTETLISYTGEAADGEVEDYQVSIIGLDYGDAPDPPFASTRALNGPRHAISSLYLGASIDAETDAQHNADANGDTDNGVTLPAIFRPGATQSVTVIASGAGKLDAWIDWDNNGFWASDEKVFDDELVSTGSNSLNIIVPSNATTTSKTFARFRLSSGGGLADVGYAPDGEVEDYAFAVQNFDFGDAPSPYPTLLADDGARHILASSLSLGAVDADVDGQPDVNAQGDDTDGTNDEDGVSFLGDIFAGATNAVQINASQAGVLNAWLDANDDGDWDDPGEQIFTDFAVPSGTTIQNFTYPNVAAPSGGIVFTRFRLSSDTGLLPTGQAADGEVEDHFASVVELDFGDAPSPYPTLEADDGARHIFQGVSRLGANVDFDGDGQPSTGADGDDTDGTPDDEDGVTFDSLPLQLNSTATVLVDAPNNGFLSAWIDFNADGDWSDPGEQIFVDEEMTIAGVNTLTFSVPDLGGPSASARFRISDSPEGLAPTGLADTGEVEDYVVAFQSDLDFGDAPDSYGTLLASGGARHQQIGNALFLGNVVDQELDGQPSVDAQGDDGNPALGLDDEDGVEFLQISGVFGAFLSYKVNQLPAFLSLWIDANGDGDWDDPGERIIQGEELTFEEAILPRNLNAPVVIPNNPTFARVRVTSSPASILSPNGYAADGEVEDYQVTIREVDFGDAPAADYPTLAFDNGAVHLIDGVTFLGSGVDGEDDGQPTANADGDDSDGNDDEDGVAFLSPLIAGGEATVEITASVPGFVSGWIDFNKTNAWDDFEDILFLAEPVDAGINTLSFDVPDTVSADIETFARFRFSTFEVISPTGLAFLSDGEVEDYKVSIEGIPAVDCTSVLIRDNLLGAISASNSISIEYLDPQAGGVGGDISLIVTHPTEADRLRVTTAGGLDQVYPATGTETTIDLSTLGDGAPSADLDTTFFGITCERETVPSSGVYVQGAPCSASVSWIAASCGITGNFPEVLLGESNAIDVQLRNVRFDTAFSNAFGVVKKTGGGTLATLATPDAVDVNNVDFEDAVEFASWMASDAGEYIVEFQGPGNSPTLTTCSVTLETTFESIDCAEGSVIVADNLGSASGNDIAINFLDPFIPNVVGGPGGEIQFTCTHPARTETIEVFGSDGFSGVFPATGTETTFAINTLSDGSPSVDAPSVGYEVYYREGNSPQGERCAVRVAWAPPSCMLELNPSNPAPFQLTDVNMFLTNVRKNPLDLSTVAEITYPTGSGPQTVSLFAPDAFNNTLLAFEPALGILDWMEEENAGTYTVKYWIPGTTDAQSCEMELPDTGSEGEGEGEDGIHTADQNADNMISLSELLRVIQFFNSGGFSCVVAPDTSEDGYVPGPGDETCTTYDADYNPQDWEISLSELLRIIQFYNSGGYRYCPLEVPPTEDGYCPGR